MFAKESDALSVAEIVESEPIAWTSVEFAKSEESVGCDVSEGRGVVGAGAGEGEEAELAGEEPLLVAFKLLFWLTKRVVPRRMRSSTSFSGASSLTPRAEEDNWFNKA